MRRTMVAVIADELSRYSMFAICLSTLTMPEGSTIRFALGRNLVRNANHLCRSFLEGDYDAIWWQGDDHVFESDTLLRLLSRLDENVHCVVPLMLMRQNPFPPVIFSGQAENGQMIPCSYIPENELFEVYAAGTGGMLVSREAMEALGPAPFDFTALDNGEILGEDFTFCKRIREAGFAIHCDTSVRMGHLMTTSVWPEHRDDGWAVRLDFNSGAQTHDGNLRS